MRCIQTGARGSRPDRTRRIPRRPFRRRHTHPVPMPLQKDLFARRTHPDEQEARAGRLDLLRDLPLVAVRKIAVADPGDDQAGWSPHQPFRSFGHESPSVRRAVRPDPALLPPVRRASASHRSLHTGGRQSRRCEAEHDAHAISMHQLASRSAAISAGFSRASTSFATLSPSIRIRGPAPSAAAWACARI